MAFYNPVRNLMNDSEKGPDPNGMAGKMDMVREADKALHPATPAPAKSAPVKPSPADKVNPKGAYGNKPGEKRIDTKEMTKPLGSFKKGGDVPKTGVYKLHEGEHVVPAHKTEKLKAAMGLAADALSHGEPDEDDMPMQPQKRVKDMLVRKLHDNSFHITHKHEMPHDMPMHDEEGSVPDMDGLKAHMEQHFGK